MTRFTTDNTEGYSAAELVVLNAEFARRVATLAENDNDDHGYDAIAESVLADFDSSINDDNYA